MSAAATSPAQPVNRRRVTDVVGMIQATGMAVTHCQGDCAVRLFTREGVYLVRVPFAVFAATARAERDANGHPFPAPRAVLAEVVEAQLVAYDAAVPVTKFAPLPPIAEPVVERVSEPVQVHASKDGAASARCVLAWEDLAEAPLQRVEEVCARHGVNYHTFCAWSSVNHTGELTRLRAGRRPRGRSILTAEQAAARGLPLTKPSGSL